MMNEAFDKHLFNLRIKKEFIEGTKEQRIAFCKEYLKEHDIQENESQSKFEKCDTQYDITRLSNWKVYNLDYTISDYECQNYTKRQYIEEMKKNELMYSLTEQIFKDDMIIVNKYHNPRTFETVSSIQIGVFRP